MKVSKTVWRTHADCAFICFRLSVSFHRLGIPDGSRWRSISPTLPNMLPVRHDGWHFPSEPPDTKTKSHCGNYYSNSRVRFSELRHDVLVQSVWDGVEDGNQSALIVPCTLHKGLFAKSVHTPFVNVCHGVNWFAKYDSFAEVLLFIFDSQCHPLQVTLYSRATAIDDIQINVRTIRWQCNDSCVVHAYRCRLMTTSEYTSSDTVADSAMHTVSVKTPRRLAERLYAGRKSAPLTNKKRHSNSQVRPQ